MNKNNDWENNYENFRNNNLLDFAISIQEIISENKQLKAENVELKKQVKELKEVRDEVFNNSCQASNNWINAILNGDVKINNVNMEE